MCINNACFYKKIINSYYGNNIEYRGHTSMNDNYQQLVYEFTKFL